MQTFTQTGTTTVKISSHQLSSTAEIQVKITEKELFTFYMHVEKKTKNKKRKSQWLHGVVVTL